MSSVLTTEQRRRWNEEGWCVLDRVVPPDLLAGAQRAIGKLFPTPEQMAEPPTDTSDDRWRTWDAQWPEFPYRSRSLNAIAVSDLLIDIAEDLIGTDVRMYMAVTSAKYANQPSGYNQLLHVDFPNHSITVPRPEPGYHQVESFVYLTDVTPANGATRFMTRRRTTHVPVEEHTLNLNDYAELYEDTTDASAPAGSVVLYRPDTFHRSIDFTDPGLQRVMMHVSYRSAAAEWGNYQAWAIKGFSAEWHDFVQQATPRQLAVLGFPAPGHPFWTAATLDGVGRRYPGLDLSPWREAASIGVDPIS
jgi:ectoine hydroxylase-related dioxygenase (phytanoyl-CoA dioxygenase family)